MFGVWCILLTIAIVIKQTVVMLIMTRVTLFVVMVMISISTSMMSLFGILSMLII